MQSSAIGSDSNAPTGQQKTYLENACNSFYTHILQSERNSLVSPVQYERIHFSPKDAAAAAQLLAVKRAILGVTSHKYQSLAQFFLAVCCHGNRMWINREKPT